MSDDKIDPALELFERQRRELEKAGFREVGDDYAHETLPGWTFAVNEVSMGHYRVTGTDGAGRHVEADDSEVDAALRKAASLAMRVGT